jgi:hypothetical protein
MFTLYTGISLTVPSVIDLFMSLVAGAAIYQQFLSLHYSNRNYVFMEL